MASVSHNTARAMAHAQNSTTNRRALLGGLAVAPLAAQAEAAHPDATLLELERRFDLVDVNYQEAASRAAELEDVGLTAAPEALFMRRGDADLYLDLFVKRDGRDRCWFYGSCVEHDSKHHGQRPCLKCWYAAAELRPAVKKRIEEIIAAYDGWIAAKERAQKDSGFCAVDMLVKALARDCIEIDQQIKAQQPRTLQGLAVKARQLQRLVDQDCDVYDDALIVIQDILYLNKTLDIGRLPFREIAAGLPATT